MAGLLPASAELSLRSHGIRRIIVQETIPAAPPDFLRGVIAPMLTPCHPDGSLDLTGAQHLAEWLAERRCVRTVFARSGLGRMFTFTMDETRRYAEAVKRGVGERMGMLLGAGGEWLDKGGGGRPDPERYTAQAVELTRFAQELGADGAVHVLPQALAPRGGEPTEETIFRYYQTVHDATNLPLVVYQPGGLAPEYRMTPALLRRLLTLPRIAGMKVSTQEEAVFAPLAEVVRGTRFALICGHEGYYLRGLEQGAVGVIGQGCVAYPEILAAVQERFYQGDREGAERAIEDVRCALRVTEGLDVAVALKQYLHRKGAWMMPYDRSGMEPYTDDVMKRVEERLDALRRPYRLSQGS